MPNATVVADIFHVMKQINEELDKQKKPKKELHSKRNQRKKRKRYYQSKAKVNMLYSKMTVT